MSFNHNGMVLEINNRKKIGKLTNTWKFLKYPPKNPWVVQEIKWVIGNYFEMKKI